MDSLFVLTDSGHDTYLMRYHVDNGTLVMNRTRAFYERASWIGLFSPPVGNETLLLVSESGLHNVDPVSMTITLRLAGTIENPTLGDMDGDGVPELLYVGRDGNLRCVDLAAGSWEWKLNLTAPVETLLVGEVDGDGDPELVISYTGGHLEVLDGPTRQVMSDSLVFATQVNKLFRDPRFLTVEDVLMAGRLGDW